MKRRVKINDAPSFYHCMSRTVNGESLFDDVEKRVFRGILRRAADFSGVEVFTFCLMTNHFHVVVRVPKRDTPVSDAELVRRFAVLYPKPTMHMPMPAAVLQKVLIEGGRDADSMRRRLLARMHDVSEFMKTLKQRFSHWYNGTHGRFGPLWAERFTSVLVEGGHLRHNAVLTVAAYVDLNPVRAGLVKDPKDYVYSGYGEAVAGVRDSRAGLVRLTGAKDWRQAQASYRKTLYGKGAASGGGAVIPLAKANKVMAARGELSLAEVLRCRLVFLTRGAVVGGREFVESAMRRHGGILGLRKRKHPGGGISEDLCSARNPRAG